MSSITKVALAGATGNLGPTVLTHLLDAGFQVTVLTRQSSSHSFPASITVIPVDYDSLDSLTIALKGQEAVVSTIGTPVVDKQLLLVEAAARNHVKRFIPAEFGSNVLNEKTAALPILKSKVAVQDSLKKEAASSGMTYTLICTGPFLDWGIAIGFLMNLKEKSIVLMDGGHRAFSTTSIPTIAKAVVGVLKHPEETKDRAVFVHDAAPTLKKLEAMGKKAVRGDGWQETVVSVDHMLNQAWAELKKDKPNPQVLFQNFIRACVWGDGYGSFFENVDNELLGIQEMSDAELQSLVNRLAEAR